VFRATSFIRFNGYVWAVGEVVVTRKAANDMWGWSMEIHPLTILDFVEWPE